MSGTTNIPSVYVIVRNRNNETLLIPRVATGYKDGTLCLPSGHVEDGEPNSVAAARELKEEVGLDIDPQKLQHLLTMQRNEGAHNIRSDIFFLAAHGDWHGNPQNMEPEKHGDCFWVPTESLPYDQIMDFQGAALSGIAHNINYMELGWPSPKTL